MTAFYFVRSKEIGKGCSKWPSNDIGDPESQDCAEFECETSLGFMNSDAFGDYVLSEDNICMSKEIE